MLYDYVIEHKFSVRTNQLDIIFMFAGNCISHLLILEN